MASSGKSGPASEPTDKVGGAQTLQLHPTVCSTSHLQLIPPLARLANQDTESVNKLGKIKKPGSGKIQPVKWVDLFTCFHCGKEGRSPPLRRCSQCEIAYYCSKTCQKGHWKQHKAACIAAVAAKAEDARRERLARAVREKGKDKVEGGEDDALCVICLGPPVDEIEVRWLWGGFSVAVGR